MNFCISKNSIKKQIKSKVGTHIVLPKRAFLQMATLFQGYKDMGAHLQGATFKLSKTLSRKYILLRQGKLYLQHPFSFLSPFSLFISGKKGVELSPSPPFCTLFRSHKGGTIFHSTTMYRRKSYRVISMHISELNMSIANHTDSHQRERKEKK